MRRRIDGISRVLDLVYLLSLLLLTGALAGFVAGLFGVGGGIVVVPMLFHLFGHLGYPAPVAMALAVGTSLATIIPTAISSVRSHHRLGNIDWATVRLFAPAMIIAALVAGQLVSDERGTLLMLVFGGLLILVALLLFFNNKIKQGASLQSIGSKVLAALAAAAIGTVSVMAGVGGGAIGVPALRAFGLGIHRAIGTAATFGLMISLPGVAVVLFCETTPAGAPVGTYSLINFLAVLVLSSVTVFTAPLGAKLNKKMNAVLLQRVFALFLIAVGIEMLTKALY